MPMRTAEYQAEFAETYADCRHLTRDQTPHELLDQMEPIIARLKAAFGLIDHLAESPHEVDPGEWSLIASTGIAWVETLRVLRDEAWEKTKPAPTEAPE